MKHYGFSRNRFGKTWKHFLEVIESRLTIVHLADVCRDQHTTLVGDESSDVQTGL